MSLHALHDELTNDPLVRGYDAMTAEEAVADLKSMYRTRYAILNAEMASRWLLASGSRYEDLEAARDDTNLTPQERGMAKMAFAQMTNRSLNLDPNDPADFGLINALFTAVWDGAERDDLLAFLERDITRAEEIGVSNVTADKIRKVRNW